MKIDIKLSGRKHKIQQEFINCRAKRIMIRAGRRGGKTIGVANRAVKRFLEGKRVLYAAPTAGQVDTFWATVTRILAEPIRLKILYKNETERYIERPGTEQRIKAKTAWNADSLRGDYADELIFDEFQHMNEDIWDKVGAPMLLDNNGDAIFIYTPPSLHSRSISKANDKQHAAKLFRLFQEKEKKDPERYRTFHFTSYDNPYISREALAEIANDMTALSYRMEIQAEDVDEAPGGLWTRRIIEDGRIREVISLERIVVAIDPSTTSAGDDAGIIVAGRYGDNGYVLADKTIQGSPLKWAQTAVAAYYDHKADRIIAESNNGGEMVELVIREVDPNAPVTLVTASRDKHTRAEPIAALYEQGRIHHVGSFSALEDEMCLWVPCDPSPNRMDALVWALSELMLNHTGIRIRELNLFRNDDDFDDDNWKWCR
ncbi:MAG: terminase large subunit domain-containing protein [Syntrophales bacterium]